MAQNESNGAIALLSKVIGFGVAIALGLWLSNALLGTSVPDVSPHTVAGLHVLSTSPFETAPAPQGVGPETGTVEHYKNSGQGNGIVIEVTRIQHTPGNTPSLDQAVQRLLQEVKGGYGISDFKATQTPVKAGDLAGTALSMTYNGVGGASEDEWLVLVDGPDEWRLHAHYFGTSPELNALARRITHEVQRAP